MLRRLWEALVGGLILTVVWYGYRVVMKGQIFFDGGFAVSLRDFVLIWLAISLFVLVAVVVDARLRGNPDRE